MGHKRVPIQQKACKQRESASYERIELVSLVNARLVGAASSYEGQASVAPNEFCVDSTLDENGRRRIDSILSMMRLKKVLTGHRELKCFGRIPAQSCVSGCIGPYGLRRQRINIAERLIEFKMSGEIDF